MGLVAITPWLCFTDSDLCDEHGQKWVCCGWVSANFNCASILFESERIKCHDRGETWIHSVYEIIPGSSLRFCFFSKKVQNARRLRFRRGLRRRSLGCHQRWGTVAYYPKCPSGYGFYRSSISGLSGSYTRDTCMNDGVRLQPALEAFCGKIVARTAVLWVRCEVRLDDDLGCQVALPEPDLVDSFFTWDDDFVDDDEEELDEDDDDCGDDMEWHES